MIRDMHRTDRKQNSTQQVAAFNDQDSPVVDWGTEVYTGKDYLQKMLLGDPGNIAGR